MSDQTTPTPVEAAPTPQTAAQAEAAMAAPVDTSTALDEDAEFSLADLADLDVSDIAEIRFETLPAGVYEFECIESGLSEQVSKKDGGKRFKATWDYKVVECLAVLEPNVDKEALAGRKHGESQWINPAETKENIEKAIGRIRAFVADMGGESAGKLGQVVGENSTGLRFRAKIVKQKNQETGDEFARIRLEKRKAA